LDLQTSIPVNYSEYVMSVPEYFTSVLIWKVSLLPR
jgi:hypothetical protein